MAHQPVGINSGVNKSKSLSNLLHHQEESEEKEQKVTRFTFSSAGGGGSKERSRAGVAVKQRGTSTKDTGTGLMSANIQRFPLFLNNSHSQHPQSSHSQGHHGHGHDTPHGRPSSISSSGASTTANISSETTGSSGTGTKKRPRKLWTLQDRSAMSVHLLKANLAEEGCEQSQLNVAKSLLNEIESPESKFTAATTSLHGKQSSAEENARLAIYWLVKSSEQGNEEATQLLQECLQENRGITWQNLIDVTTCINTPQNEKLTYKAVRILYEKLSNGEDFVTTSQLAARLLTQKQSPPKPKRVSFPRNEADAAGSEMLGLGTNGKLKLSPRPPTSPVGAFDPNATFIIDGPLNLTKTTKATRTTGSFAKDEVFSERKGVMSSSGLIPSSIFPTSHAGEKLTLGDLLNVAKSYNVGQVPPFDIMPNPTAHRIWSEWKLNSSLNRFFLQLLILALASKAWSFDNSIFIGIGFLCLWSCYNIFIWGRRAANFSDWTDSFKSVLRDTSWTETIPKRRLGQKYLLPYLFTNVTSLALLTFLDSSVPRNISLVFGCISILVLLRLVLRSGLPSWEIFFICGLQIGSYYFDHLVNYLNLDAPFDLGEMDFDVGLSCSILVYMIHGLLGTILVLRSPRIELVEKVIPEILVSLWLLKVINSSTSLELVVTGSCLMILGSFLILVKFSRTRVGKLFISFLFLLILGLIIAQRITLPPQTLISCPDGLDSNSNYISWEEYEGTCHKPSWISQTMAETQMKCSTMYKDRKIRWKVRVGLVKLKDQVSGGSAPDPSQPMFEIFFNAGVKDKSDDNEDGWKSYIPIKSTLIGGHSNLELTAPGIATISTSSLSPSKNQEVTKYLLNLRTGDHIEITGILLGNLGGVKPEIGQVTTLTCLSCSLGGHSKVEIEQGGWIQYLYNRMEWIQQFSHCFSNYFKDQLKAMTLLKWETNYLG